MTRTSDLSTILDRPHFIDRDDEKELVLKGLRSANKKRGGMILVDGEAGIGKTRFIEECMREAKESGFRVLEGKCLDYRRSPYLPFVEMIRDYFGISLERLEQENLVKLADSIEKEFDSIKIYKHDLLDFFFPHYELLGSYVSDRDHDVQVLEGLQSRGYRTIIVGSIKGLENGTINDQNTALIKIGAEDRGSINPKRVEKIAAMIKESFQKYRHCAILFNGFDEVVDGNPAPKVKKLMEISGDLSRHHGGVIVFSSKKKELDIMDNIPILDPDCSSREKPKNELTECLEGEKKGISIYELLPQFFKEISGRSPILIVIEDLQWSDKATHNLLQFLSRDARKERILIIGSYRSEESAIEDGSEGQVSLRDTLRRMSREHLFNTISLGRFDQERSMLLAAAIQGHEMDMKHIGSMMRETGGNPRFIVDFMKKVVELDTELVPTERTDQSDRNDLIANRVASLETKERDILEIAAIMGENITVEKLSLVLGMEVEDVLDALDPLMDLKFLHEKGDFFVFEQPRVKESICDGIPKDKLTMMHGKIARAFENVEGRLAEDQTVDLALHHYHCGEFEKALTELIDRTLVQMARGDLDKALSTLDLADNCFLHIDDNNDKFTNMIKALQLRGDIQDRKGNYLEGIVSYRESIKIAERNGIEKELPINLRRLADLLLKGFEWDATIESYLRSLHISKRLGDEAETAQAFKGLGKIYLIKGEYNRSIECYVKYMEYPGTRNGPGHVQGLTEMGDIYFQVGDFNQALAYYKLAIKKGEEADLYNETSLAHVKMASVLLKLGEVEESRRYGELAQSQVQGREPSSVTYETLLNYADLMLELGELEKAEEVIKDLEGSVDSMDRLLRSIAYRVKGMMFSKMRDFKGSISQMKASISTLEEIEAPYHLAVSYFNFGLIRFQQMDVEGALEMLKKAGDIFKDIKSLFYFNRTSSKIREVSFIREGLRS